MHESHRRELQKLLFEQQFLISLQENLTFLPR